MCSCGRSFSTEITIRETTNVEATSPPATPMLSSKSDLKHHPYIQTSVSKRAKTSAMESITSLIPTTTLNELVDRLHPPTNMINWHTTNVKHYENSPGWFGTDVDRSQASLFLFRAVNNWIDAWGKWYWTIEWRFKMSRWDGRSPLARQNDSIEFYLFQQSVANIDVSTSAIVSLLFNKSSRKCSIAE